MTDSATRGGPDPLTDLSLASLFDAAPVALSLVDLAGRQRAANAEFRRLFHMEHHEAPEVNAFEVTHPEALEGTVAYLSDLRSGRVEQVEVTKRFVRPDGTEFTGRVRSTLVRDHRGEPAAFLGAISDITAEVEHQAEIEHDRRRSWALLGNLIDTVTVLGADGIVTEASGVFPNVLGYGQHEWIGRDMWDLIEPDDLWMARRAYEAIIATPRALVNEDIRMRSAAGTWQPVEVSAVNLLDEPGVSGIVLMIRDLSQRRLLEMALQRERDTAVEEARLRSEFVARVSHELRNQVHALAGLTELVSTSEVPRAVRDLATSANRQAIHLQGVVEELLELGRARAGGTPTAPSPTPVRQLVSDAVALGKSLASAGVRVRGRVAEAVAEVVLLDARLTSQVLANLMGNAAKFTERGQIDLSVTATFHHDRPALRFAVRDTGKGIPETDLSRVFQPFEQVDHSDRGRGSGLGLAITRGLVEAMGGTISVDSTAGVGSVFSVVLPAAPTDAEVDAHRGPDTPRLPQGTRVLVAEDNEVNQLLVTEQIRRMGAAVVVVGDGAAAVEAVRRSGRFDVVLMDWQMPGVDGVTATRQIRDMERAEGLDPICILGMSASGTTADRHTCLGAGMDDLLTKPVGLAALGAALRQHVGGSRTPSGPEPEAEPRAFGADTAALDRLVQELGTRDPVLSIVRSYLDELATRRTALEDAVARGDEAALRRTAHALRATSRTLGAESVDAVALALEQGPFPPSPALLADFATAAEHTAVDLGAWLEHNG